jgi:hypothetical protein
MEESVLFALFYIVPPFVFLLTHTYSAFYANQPFESSRHR